MSTEVFRALIADTISTMSIEQLRNVILETPDKDLGAVGAAVLAEKGKKAVNAEVPPVGMKAVKKKGGTKTVKNTPGKQTPTPVGSSSKRKCKSWNNSSQDMADIQMTRLISLWTLPRRRQKQTRAIITSPVEEMEVLPIPEPLIKGFLMDR